MLSVQMLGVFTISVDGKRLVDDLGPTGRLLSGYLFEFIGRVHRRDRLADEFWSRLEPERARAALNTALWRLRKMLAREPLSNGGQNLRTNGSEILLEPASWLTVDTHELTSSLKFSLDPGAAADTEMRLHTIEAAIQSYVGPFLDGEDADWILEERERLHSLYIRGAAELVRCYGGAQRYEDAIAVARRILAADPFRESVLRLLLVLLLLDGQRACAIRQYDRWKIAFRNELNIDPMPQTVRLAEDIRSGEIFSQIEALSGQYFQTPKDGGSPPHLRLSRPAV